VHYNSKTYSSESELKAKLSAESFEGEEPGRKKSASPEPGTSTQEEELVPPQKSWPPPEFPTVRVTVDEEEEEVVLRRLVVPTPTPKVPPRPSPPYSLEPMEPRDSTSSMSSKKSGIKKANLYAWLSLQSLPEVRRCFTVFCVLVIDSVISYQ
jgi:hypothetical protein